MKAASITKKMLKKSDLWQQKIIDRFCINGPTIDYSVVYTRGAQTFFVAF